MKQRELRQTVVIRARMRDDAAWSDVTIRNVSSRGMMLQMSKPPVMGSYIELRRDQVIVIGRVMWADDDCCGLRTQQRVDLRALQEARTRADYAEAPERRAAPRRENARRIAERATVAGRNLQFAFVGLFAACAVALLTMTSFEALSRPIAAIETALK